MIIIYKNKDNSIGIITPTEEALKFFTIEQIAKKDVPKNLPYWLIKKENIPADKTYRDAWTLSENQGKPDGFGGENNEFDAQLLNKYLENIK